MHETETPDPQQPDEEVPPVPGEETHPAPPPGTQPGGEPLAPEPTTVDPAEDPTQPGQPAQPTAEPPGQ